MESLSLLSAMSPWGFADTLPMLPLYIILQIHKACIICIVIFLSLIMQFLTYKHMESNKLIRNNQTRTDLLLFVLDNLISFLDEAAGWRLGSKVSGKRHR